MTTKTYRLIDLEGEPWLISPGDPSHPLLDRLDKLSWEPRLPARVFASGQVDDFDLHDGEVALQNLVEMIEQDGDMLQLLDSLILDAHRTLRQLRYLKEGEGHETV